MKKQPCNQFKNIKMKKTLISIAAMIFLISCEKTSLTSEVLPATPVIGTETFLNGTVTTSVTTTDATHYKIIIQKNGKILEMTQISSADGVKVQSTTGIVYYQINAAGDVTEVNQIPFGLIGIDPPANLITCLRNAVKLCKQSGFCKGVYFTNIFGVTSFSFGMTLKCTFFN